MKNEIRRWLAMRVDGDGTIGLGHVMRCLALAGEARARDLDVRLLARSLDESLRSRLDEVGVDLHELPQKEEKAKEEVELRYNHSGWLNVSESTDAKESLDCIQALSDIHGAPAAIVVDHYALAKPWHEKLRALAPVLAIDELVDRPLAPDYFVDQTAGRSADDYAGLVPDSTRLLLGGSYALLRPEFSARAEVMGRNRGPVSSPLRVLVTMGGGDPGDASSRVLPGLAQAAQMLPLEATLVIGGANPNLARLREVAAACDFPLDVVVDSHDMAELMATHHLAVGAAGTTSWERCSMGLPSLNFVLAVNQESVCDSLPDAGAAVDMGHIRAFESRTLAEAIVEIANQPERYASMVQAAFVISDGRGCARVLDSILDNKN